MKKPAKSDDRPRGSEEDGRQYLVHLEKINSVYYDQIKIADQKAAFIFTFMLAFLVSSAEGRSVFSMERYQSGSWPLILLSALLAVAVAVSLVSAVLVVLPRHRAKAFVAAHDARDPDYLFNEYLNNVDNLAMINRSKYRHVAISFRGLIVSVLAYLAMLVVGPVVSVS